MDILGILVSSCDFNLCIVIYCLGFTWLLADPLGVSASSFITLRVKVFNRLFVYDLLSQFSIDFYYFPAKTAVAGVNSPSYQDDENS